MKEWLSALIISVSLAVGALDINLVLPENSLPAEKNAAEELKKYLDLCIEKKMIINGRKIENIHVGNTDLFRKEGVKLRDEEWMIKSSGSNLILSGGGFRGTYYAMAVFAEKYLGVYRWSQFEEYIPAKRETLVLSSLNDRSKPYFLQRYIYVDTSLPRDKGHFAAFNRLNLYGRHDIDRIYGGAGFRYGKPDMAHTFDRYIPAGKYLKTHPEYFSKIEGRRTGGQRAGQLCLTNPNVLELIWSQMVKNIEESDRKAERLKIDAPRLYEVSANDNNKVCHCPDCQAVIDREGADMGLMLDFVNKLAARLKKFRPGYYITTLAYWNTEKFPKFARPADNVIIRICNTAQNYVTPISADGSTSYRNHILQWGRAAKIMTWDYMLNFFLVYQDHNVPIPNEFILQEQLQFYKKNNVAGVFLEHEHPHAADMSVMKTFLEAKLLEDPDLDFDKLYCDFTDQYYGAAGKYVREYRKTLFQSAKRHNSQVFAYMIAPAAFTYLDFDTILKSYQLFEKAFESVKGNPIFTDRLAQAKMSLNNGVIVRWRQINLEWIERGNNITDFPLDRQRIAEEYLTVRKNLLVKYYGHKDAYYKSLLKRTEERLNNMLSIPVVVPEEKFSDEIIEMTMDMTKNWRNQLVRDHLSPVGFAVKKSLAKTTDKNEHYITVGGYCSVDFSNQFRSVIKNLSLNNA